jgi:hypothetical protein
MKKIVILFISIMWIQNINAQGNPHYNQAYYNENIVMNENLSPDFDESLPVQRGANQIVVKTKAKKTIRSSSNIEIGKIYYLFEVTQAEDASLIGLPVACQVVDIRKSNLSGSEGRLILRPQYVESGAKQIPLVHNDIYRRGLNRSNVKFWLSIFVIPMFIAGSGAEITPDEEIVLTLDTNTDK